MNKHWNILAKGAINIPKKRLKIKHYKNQLSSYEYWISELAEVNAELKALKRLIEEPKVTQYGDKEMTDFSDNRFFKYNGVLEREQNLIHRRAEIEYYLSKCVELLTSIDGQISLILYGIYVKGMRTDQLAIDNGYSKASMYRAIEKELKGLTL